MDLQTSAVCRLALVIRLREEIGRGSLDYTVMSFWDAQNARNILDIRGIVMVWRRVLPLNLFLMKVSACW